MKFDGALDGRFIVSNEIQINIEGELLEKSDAAEAAPAAEATDAKS